MELNFVIFTIGVAIIFVLTRLWIRRTYSYWRRRGVRTFPTVFPFGNFWPLVRQETNFAHVVQRIYQQCKNSYCGIYLFTKPVFMITDMNLIGRVMITDTAHFYDRGFHCDPERDPLTGSILQLGGQVWKEMRSKLSPAFSLGKLKLMFPAMDQCAIGLQRSLVAHIERGEEFDARNLSMRYSVDVIASIGFGVEPGTITTPDNPFGKIAFDIVGLRNFGQVRLMINFFYKQMAKFWGISIVNPGVQKMMFAIVNEILEYRDQNKVERNDFIQMLIKLRDTGSISDEETVMSVAPRLTVNQIAAQSFFFYLAGFETTAGAITFTLYELARNPDILKRVQQEVDDVLKRHDGKFNVESMNDMVYLEKCLTEVMRLHPPVPFHSRECTKAYQIPDSDLVIEKGTQVYIPVYSIHHDEQFFKNPETFDPERVELNGKTTKLAYMPFGHGPRACIGLRMAYHIVKISIVELVVKYNFELGPSMNRKMELDPMAVFNYPKGGIQLRASYR